MLVQHDRQLLGTAVPTIINISMITSKINNVKKINISFQCKAQHAVLLTCSSRTGLNQSHINMLNLTLVLGRYTHWFLLQTASILSSCRSGIRACLSNWRQRKCILKTVTLNIQGDKDTQMDGRTAVCVCVCICVCVCKSMCALDTAEARLQLVSRDVKTEQRSNTEGNDRGRR